MAITTEALHFARRSATWFAPGVQAVGASAHGEHTALVAAFPSHQAAFDWTQNCLKGLACSGDGLRGCVTPAMVDPYRVWYIATVQGRDIARKNEPHDDPGDWWQAADALGQATTEEA